MCGRYALAETNQDLSRYRLSADMPVYNIAPHKYIAADRAGSAMPEACKWGLMPDWEKNKKDPSFLYNVKSESIADRPAFAKLLSGKRCAVPASGYYDWRRLPYNAGKQPFYISLADMPLFYFAAIWDYYYPNAYEDPVLTTAVITVTANEKLEKISSRMPVILSSEDLEIWQNPDIIDPNMLLGLLKPYPSHLIRAWEVSKTVNDPLNDLPECIEKLKGIAHFYDD